MRTVLVKSKKIGVLALLFLFMVGCTEDDGPNIVGRTNQADFSFEVDENDPFTVHFTNESGDYHSSYWNFGDDSEFTTEDSPVHTFPSGGVYDVVLAVQGDDTGGEISKEIEIIDPALQGERIEDGNFQNEDAWNVGEAGYDILSDVEFTEDGLNISNGNETIESNVVVWQEFEVEAGKEYYFTAQVEGGGMDQAWLEFHFSNTPPDGGDYAENNLWSLNTWAECGIEPFEGDITELSCNGNGGEDGTFTFEEGGTAYIVIKSGSWQGTLGPDGVTISDLSLLKVEELE